jgi:predicted ATPase
MGQWHYSLMNDKLTATMQIAQRVYSRAREQNDPALMVGAHSALAMTHHFLGDFEAGRIHAMHGVQIWRSGSVQSQVEDLDAPATTCLCYAALCAWHFGEIVAPQPNMVEAISLAKEMNHTHGLTSTLYYAASIAYHERNPAEVERLASDVIELSTRHHFAHWLALGSILRGWARSASGDTVEGRSWIEDGIRDYRAAGAIIGLPYLLGMKAEALHLADRTSEALEAIKEAEVLVERFEERWWCAELYRLRAVFLTAMGADETQVEASFCAATRIAKEQNSVSLKKRAEGTYVEYRRQKASASAGRGFRLPLC